MVFLGVAWIPIFFFFKKDGTVNFIHAIYEKNILIMMMMIEGKFFWVMSIYSNTSIHDLGKP